MLKLALCPFNKGGKVLDTVDITISGNETFLIYHIEAWVEEGEEFSVSFSQLNHNTCSYEKERG